MAHDAITVTCMPGSKTAPVRSLENCLRKQARERIEQHIAEIGKRLKRAPNRIYVTIEAMRALTAAAQWRDNASLPEAESLPDFLTQLPAQDITVLDEGSPGAETARKGNATYTRPYQTARPNGG
jgi:hypothetical protein